jgi:nucleoside-diphosphate-sugar epimerase
MPEGVRGWAVDLRHYDGVRAAIDAIRPEIVFHLAAFVTTRRDRELIRPMLEHTLTSTVNLLNAASDVYCKRVIITSSAEASTRVGAAPTSPYSVAKASSELFAALFQHAYSLPTVILRPTLVYGPGQAHDKLLPYIIASLLRRAEPQLSCPQRICDMLYVRDLIDALCAAAIAPEAEGKTIDIGSGTRVCIADLVQCVMSQLSGERYHTPLLSRSPDAADLVVDTEPSFHLLSWRAKWTLQEGLAATVPTYAPDIQRREVA